MDNQDKLAKITAKRLNLLLEKYGKKQCDLCRNEKPDGSGRTTFTESEISDYARGVRPISAKKAKQLTKEFFPDVLPGWILGDEDFMTEQEKLDSLISKTESNYNKSVSAITHLATLKNIHFALYDSGIYFNDAEDRYEDRYIIRKGSKETTMTYGELSDLIDDLAALTEARLTRALNKA